MGNPFGEHPSHSAEYFGDTRDHWWNRDYLELVARCQAAGGDTAGAVKTVKRILKQVEEHDDKAYYEKLEKELKGK